MYENMLADCLTLLTLLTDGFWLLGKLIRIYLYDMNKRVSQRNRAGKNSADKLQRSFI